MVLDEGKAQECESSHGALLSPELVLIRIKLSDYCPKSFKIRGAWIRPMVGRNKRKWSKVAKRKVRAERHVFCNATQSTMLDKMVTNYWRKRRFYIDDIYEPYHIREEYPMTATKPRQC